MTVPAPPRISVLLPCRDAAATLPECIAGLEAQTEPRFEALVLDDGSTDDTPLVLGAWAERDARVRRVPADGGGLVAALQALSRAARGTLLARMDADDVAHPTRLARQVELLAARPEVAACGTGVRYVPRDAVGPGYRRYEAWLNGLSEPTDLVRDLFVECPIAHPTLMVRRAAFAAVGGYREFDGPEDYDLVLRLVAVGYGIANVPEVLHDWRLGEGRLSTRSARYAPAAFRRLKVRVLAGVVPPDRPVVIWGAGRVGKAFARAWSAGTGRPPTAFVDLDPRKIGQRIHGAPVEDPPALAARIAGPGGRPFVLIAVGSPGARADIRAALDTMGMRDIEDHRAVA